MTYSSCAVLLSLPAASQIVNAMSKVDVSTQHTPTFLFVPGLPFGFTCMQDQDTCQQHIISKQGPAESPTFGVKHSWLGCTQSQNQ